MHDPMTVAFDIPNPFARRYSFGKSWRQRPPLVTIWHCDPETDGSDDSCGWFCRSRHGDKETLAKIEQRFKFECFAEHCGMFDSEGKPRLSSMAITLNLFRAAAYIHFGENWKKTDRFLERNLLDLLFLAENTVDSLHTSITNRYGVESKERRTETWAAVVYGWILRAERPWYRHPRWHIHHWRLQVHPWQRLRRWMFERCSKCGKGYPWGYAPIGNWSGTESWHHECDPNRPVETQDGQP
jgi:hypothetical protein